MGLYPVSDWPGTHYVYQTVLELEYSIASAFRELGLKVCTETLCFRYLNFLIIIYSLNILIKIGERNNVIDIRHGIACYYVENI